MVAAVSAHVQADSRRRRQPGVAPLPFIINAGLTAKT